MEITGTIKVIGDTNQVSDKFKKRDVVITLAGQYPQDILCQLTQDKCSLIDSYTVGNEIKAHINLRGRGWTNPQGEVKYFNTVEVWKIEGQAGQVAQHATVVDDNSDLPF